MTHDEGPRTAHRPPRHGLTTVVNGLLTGAGSLYLVTGSGVVTTVTTALAVLLVGLVVRGRRRSE